MRSHIKMPQARRLHLFKILNQNAKALSVESRVRRRVRDIELHADLEHLKSAALQSLEPRR